MKENQTTRTLGSRTVPTPRVEGRPGITSWTGRSLMMPEEIMSMEPARMVILPQEGWPVPPCKPRYDEDAEFAGLFEVAV